MNVILRPLLHNVKKVEQVCEY